MGCIEGPFSSIAGIVMIKVFGNDICDGPHRTQLQPSTTLDKSDLADKERYFMAFKMTERKSKHLAPEYNIEMEVKKIMNWFVITHW